MHEAPARGIAFLRVRTRIRRVASALVMPGGSIPRRRDSRRATAFCARVRPAVPAAPDSPLVRRARLRPQMAQRRVGCALHIASAAAGLAPLRHCGNTLAPTPTRDYAPSLRSPWRAAKAPRQFFRRWCAPGIPQPPSVRRMPSRLKSSAAPASFARAPSGQGRTRARPARDDAIPAVRRANALSRAVAGENPSRSFRNAG